MQNARIDEGLHFNGEYPLNLKFQNCNVFSKTNSFSTTASDLAFYKGSICVLDLLWEKTEKAEGIQEPNDFENMPKLNQDSNENEDETATKRQRRRNNGELKSHGQCSWP